MSSSVMPTKAKKKKKKKVQQNSSTNQESGQASDVTASSNGKVTTLKSKKVLSLSLSLSAIFYSIFSVFAIRRRSWAHSRHQEALKYKN